MSRKLRDDLPVTKITDSVYLISDFKGTNCYLIIGDEKALLIDCGTGYCDLRGCVEKLTDKPVILALTHGHVDHLGGAGQFEEAYVHYLDNKLINDVQKTRLARILFFATSGATKKGFSTKDIFKDEYKTKYIEISDGHEFDLGGKIIKVKHTPGHTVGSVSFIDEKDKIVFCGDNMCDALWMFMPGVATIEEWIPSAEWLYEMSEEYRIFWGHRKPELDREYIHTVLSWGRDILALHGGKNAKISKKVQYPKKRDGIIYLTGKVYKG